jgi:hypothetical protein
MLSVTEKMNAMLRRCVTLHGVRHEEDKDGNPVAINTDKAVREFLTLLAKDEPKPAEQAKILLEAWEAGAKSDKMLALNAIRVEQVSNYISAESTFMSMFFEQVSLAPDEEPKVTNDTTQEIRVTAMGEDGHPDRIRIVKPQSKIDIGLQFLMSDKVSYKILDLYRGRVDGVATKTFNIADNMRFKVDRSCFNVLNKAASAGGAYGAFSLEQGRARKEQRIYLAHSGIVTSHLPTTNDIVQGAQAGPVAGTRFTVRYYDAISSNLTGLRPAVLLAIIDYADSWANVLPGGGRLVPTGEIIVPSSDIINIALTMVPTNNTTESRIQEDVNRDGYTSIQYLGRTWKFIADVTIPPGTCYPRFNMLPGRVYFKPNMDKEFVETDEGQNEETRWQRKVWGAYIICQYRPRTIRIKYIP